MCRIACCHPTPTPLLLHQAHQKPGPKSSPLCEFTEWIRDETLTLASAYSSQYHCMHYAVAQLTSVEDQYKWVWHLQRQHQISDCIIICFFEMKGICDQETMGSYNLQTVSGDLLQCQVTRIQEKKLARPSQRFQKASRTEILTFLDISSSVPEGSSDHPPEVFDGEECCLILLLSVKPGF